MHGDGLEFGLADLVGDADKVVELVIREDTLVVKLLDALGELLGVPEEEDVVVAVGTAFEDLADLLGETVLLEDSKANLALVVTDHSKHKVRVELVNKTLGERVVSGIVEDEVAAEFVDVVLDGGLVRLWDKVLDVEVIPRLTPAVLVV